METTNQMSASMDGRTIVMSANAFWNIANFRAGLISSLVTEGHHVIIAAPGPDRQWAARFGAEAVSIPIDRSGLNPIRDAFTLIDYLKLMRRTSPDLFMGFTAKPNIYGCLAARLSRMPALPNVSGLGTAFMKSGPLSTLVSGLYRLAFRTCPIIFFQNSDDGELFIERKIVKREQVRILPGSGVDLIHFSPADPVAGIQFMFVGRLLGDKGVREFVDAARLLGTEHPDWKFQLLGPLDEDNRSSISQTELDRWLAEGIVEHIGQVDDVRPHIAAATAVVLPSYREGLPRSLLEAAAMARPLIATDVPGSRQVVSDGINGILCAARDPADLALAMKRMGTMTTEDRNSMGRAGRALVERDFGEATVIQAYLEALAQLCPRRRS